MNSYTDELIATHAALLAICGDMVYNYCNYQTENDKINDKKSAEVLHSWW